MAITETERVPAEDPEDETGGTTNLTTDAHRDTDAHRAQIDFRLGQILPRITVE